MSAPRKSSINCKTAETQIRVDLVLDGTGAGTLGVRIAHQRNERKTLTHSPPIAPGDTRTPTPNWVALSGTAERPAMVMLRKGLCKTSPPWLASR